jgi:hypothetical protein
VNRRLVARQQIVPPPHIIVVMRRTSIATPRKHIPVHTWALRPLPPTRDSRESTSNMFSAETPPPFFKPTNRPSLSGVELQTCTEECGATCCIRWLGWIVRPFTGQLQNTKLADSFLLFSTKSHLISTVSTLQSRLVYVYADAYMHALRRA